MTGAHVRHRRRPPRSRDEVRAAIEARIREQDRLDDETQQQLAAALGIQPRRTVRARFAALLAHLPAGRDRTSIDYPKGPR